MPRLAEPQQRALEIALLRDLLTRRLTGVLWRQLSQRCACLEASPLIVAIDDARLTLPTPFSRLPPAACRSSGWDSC